MKLIVGGKMNEESKKIVEVDDVSFALAICKKALKDENIGDDVYVNGVFEVISSLGDSFQEILRMRFRENMTYREIGEKFQLTGERIRQIERKIFYKMRHPSRVYKMRVSYLISHNDEIRKELNKTKEKYLLYKIRCRELEKLLSLDDLARFNADHKNKTISTIETSDLDLSHRLYNCLDRAGISCVAEILAFSTFQDIISIRNLGETCAYELIEVMRDIGNEKWAEKINATK